MAIYLFSIFKFFSIDTKIGFKTAANKIPANIGKQTLIINDNPFSKYMNLKTAIYNIKMGKVTKLFFFKITTT